MDRSLEAQDHNHCQYARDCADGYALLPTSRKSAKKWEVCVTYDCCGYDSGLHALAAFVDGREDDIFAALDKGSENMRDRYVAIAPPLPFHLTAISIWTKIC